MIFRVITIIMILLILAGSISASGVVLADCQLKVCCCSGMGMTGHGENYAKNQSKDRCCCEGAAGSSCRLTTIAPSEKIGWALSSTRVEILFSLFSSAVRVSDIFTAPQANFQTDASDHGTHLNSLPIYLAAMSFLY